MESIENIVISLLDKQVWMANDKYDAPREPRFEEIGDNRTYNKPYGGLWTSTYTPSKEYDSDWIRWCSREQYWTGRHAYFLEPEDDLNIIQIDSKDSLMYLQSEYSTHSHTEPNAIDFKRIVKDGYDGIHLTDFGQKDTRITKAREPDLYGWDSESTLWFNWKFKDVAYHKKY